MKETPVPWDDAMRRLLRALPIVILLGVGFGLGWVRLPYYAQGPGPARAVFPLIRFDGHPRYESSGTLLATTVEFKQVTPIEAFFVWVDPARSLVDRGVLYPPDLDEEEEDARAISQMDQSKIDAAYVVLEELTDYPEEHGEGALIEAVVPGCPADGRLFPGDLVSEVDGEAIASQDDASEAIDGADRGERLTFLVDVAGETHTVGVARSACVPDDPEAYLGIRMVEQFPFDISISSGEVGGPSAGLMWAVGLYDLMTPGDLTRGRTIAGTGVIELDGNVGPIDGIRDKVRSAMRADAAVFLTPADNMVDLRGFDSGDLAIVPVSHFDDVVLALSG
jgi:PDZ domain-containing protein